MTRSDEGMTPEHEQDIAREERDAEERSQGSEGDDPTQNPSPPGNPEADQAAVEKGEEQIGKVVGR